MATVINNYLGSKLSAQYRIKFIPTHIEANLFSKFLFFSGSVLKTLICLLDPEYKILHLHAAKHGSLIRKSAFIFLAKLFGRKTIIHTHGADFFEVYKSYGTPMKKFVRFVFGSADAVINASQKRKNEYSPLFDAGKIHVIHNFIYLPELKEKTKNQQVKIISLGRLGKRKGTFDLISAVEKIKHLDFMLELGGDGEIDLCHHLIKEKNLVEKIKIRGWVAGAEREEMLETGDVFVLPSYLEDMPMAILEAMAYEMPVVSTNIAGIPEMVEDGKSGFLIEPGDACTLAKKLSLLIENESLRREFGKRSRRLVKEEFSDEVILKKVSALYEKLGS